MKKYKTRQLLVIFALILFFAVDSRAEEGGGKFKMGIDALERQLETGRHELLTAHKKDPQSQLVPFTTDGCSGGLSVGWEYLAGKIEKFQNHHGVRPPWESCCVTHDRPYHTGGGRQFDPEESFEARKKADLELRTCVRESAIDRVQKLMVEYDLSREEIERLYEIIADLMYRAVRIGGMPCTGLPWRWGYGWPECD